MSCIHVKDDIHDELLVSASVGENLGVIKRLLDNGVDTNTKKDVALKGAARNGHIEVVKALLNKGARSDQAFYEASTNGHTDVVELLMETDDYDEDSAVNGIEGAAQNGHIDIVRLLLQHVESPSGTSFYAASENGHVAVLELLLKDVCIFPGEYRRSQKN